MCDDMLGFYLDTVGPQLQNLLTRIEILEGELYCPSELKKIKIAAQELEKAVMKLFTD